MRVIAKRTLREFWEKHPKARGQLEAWHQEAEAAQWRGSADIKAQYRSASILANNRVVFNICGNSFRLVVRIKYEAGIVLIRFIGTHEEYDKIDATKY